MIGNIEEARFIRDWYRDYRDSDPCGVGQPNGWRRMGSGCYRVAFLAPSGVVYKVQHWQNNSYQTNAGEAEKLRSLMFRKLPQGCRFPRYQLFELEGEGVMAMERFNQTMRSISSYSAEGKRLRALENRLIAALPELRDMHDDNIAVDEVNGQVVPIDLGD